MLTERHIKRGDGTVFDRLYVTLAPRVLAYLLRLTNGDRGDAEDLTQETFLAAYAARSTCAGSNPLSWLLGIARRRQRDAFRAASVRPMSVTGDVDIETGNVRLDETVSRRVVLIRALDKLPDADRDAVLLVVVQGLTYVEVAQVTGEPIGTVKWRVSAATKRLRGLLSGAFANEYAMTDADTVTVRKEATHANPEPVV